MIRLPVRSDVDIVAARQQGREFAQRGGFSNSDQTIVATVISELARNILNHADVGEIRLRLIEAQARRGILMVAHDEGPGIPNIPLALRDGGSRSKTAGLGLRGVKRLMDDFDIVSEVGKGTTVTVKKWARTANS